MADPVVVLVMLAWIAVIVSGVAWVRRVARDDRRSWDEYNDRAYWLDGLERMHNRRTS